jgi:hypothetical protein
MDVKIATTIIPKGSRFFLYAINDRNSKGDCAKNIQIKNRVSIKILDKGITQ